DTGDGVMLPANYTFTTGDGGDNGVHTFSAKTILVTVGDQILIVTDTATSTIRGSAIVTVSGPSRPPRRGTRGPRTPMINADVTRTQDMRSAQQIAWLDRLFGSSETKSWVLKSRGRQDEW